MSDVVRPCCSVCVPKCSPQVAQDFKWVLASYVGFIRGQMQGSKQHFGPRLGPSLAILLRYLEAIAISASCGKVGGS